MKKLKLRALGLGSQEILTRDELRSVSGGFVGRYFCECPDGAGYFCAVGVTEAACFAEYTSYCGGNGPAYYPTCQWSTSG